MSYIVKQPARNGKIHIHLAENHHIPEKGGARQVRKYLGILEASNNELILGTLQPEPAKEVLELLKSKGIVYNGHRSVGRGRKRSKTSLGNLKGLTVREVGRVAAFRCLAQACKLDQALSSSFGITTGEHILSLGIFLASEGAPLYLADSWSDDVGIDSSMSSSAVSRFCTEIGSNEHGRNNFFQAWIDACDRPRSLIHDTTSISTHSSLLEDSEWGYNRDGDKLPQINIALVLSRESRLPLWFRSISGSIPDVSTLKMTCQTLEAFGLKDFTCSLDRGYFSNSNVSAMLESGVGFIIGVPLGVKQAKQIVSDNRKELDKLAHSFLYRKKRLRHFPCQYLVKTSNGKETIIPGHLFLDPERAEGISSRIETTTLELEAMAQLERFESENQALEWICDNAKELSACLQVEYKEKKWIITRNLSFISKLVDNCGVTLVLSTDNNQSPQGVLADYRCRDIAEKFFDITKNDIGGGRLRTSSTENCQGRLFIYFIALILRCAFENKLKDSGLLQKYSVEEALALLRKIRKVQLTNGRLINCEIPKKTRDIASAVGLHLEN